MTTIFIQGTKHETEKTIDVLKNSFYSVSKKTSYANENGITTIVEVKEDEVHVNGFTADEIMKGLSCCTNAVRDCVSCPFKSVSNCIERLQMDAAILVSKMTNNG